jgi:hypothetical protein
MHMSHSKLHECFVTIFFKNCYSSSFPHPIKVTNPQLLPPDTYLGMTPIAL